MATLSLSYKRISADEVKYGKGYSLNSLTTKEFSSFNAEILGLGDISIQSEYRQALAAFIDLEGFTEFSNQVDSHLVIPEFFKLYLAWLFKKIGDVFKESEKDGIVKIWGSLPFYAKFLGDGILFIWDTQYSKAKNGNLNIVKSLFDLTIAYRQEFFPELQKHLSNPPPLIRCGIARGQIMSVGNGQDFVGSCINIASRLQKISSLTFAVSRRGLDFTDNISLGLNLILKKLQIRGIGNEELVYVLKSEFNSLAAKDKKFFKDP